MRFLKLSYLQEQLVLALECLLVVATISRGGRRGGGGGGGGGAGTPGNFGYLYTMED